MHYTRILDQQNRALEAATVTLRYYTALCPSMEKTREIFDLHFLAKPGFFRANYCDVTKVEVPNCMLTCNMRNEFVAVRVYQGCKIPLALASEHRWRTSKTCHEVARPGECVFEQ